MFSSFCTIKVESVSELQRTKLLPTLDTMIPSCLVEPGLCKAFNYSLKERRGERQAALCKPFNFLCQKPVVFIVGAGNVTRKSWDFGRFSFFFFSWPPKPKVDDDRCPEDLKFWNQTVKSGTFTFTWAIFSAILSTNGNTFSYWYLFLLYIVETSCHHWTYKVITLEGMERLR